MTFAWASLGRGLLSFLQAAWQPIALIVVGAFLANFFFFGPKIDKLELRLELAKAEIERMEGIVESQNTAIENASINSREEFKSILEGISQEIDDSREINDEALQRIIEAGIPEGCTDTAGYLAEQLDNLRWSNER